MIFLMLVILGITWWADTYIKEEPTLTQATAHVVFVNMMAAIWAGLIGILWGWAPAGYFLAGYAMEWALSMDNLLAIAMVFVYFSLPKRYELKILRYGIASVAIFRLIFTLAGASLLRAWERPMEVVFGLVIMYTAAKMLRASSGEQHAEMVDHNSRWYIRVLRRWIPITGDATAPVFFKKKFERIPGGNLHVYRTYATPLLACLVAVEATDIVFSLDSAPVVVAVAQDPVIIYSSMMFAVIGLRSMYFLIQAAQKHLAWMPKAIIGVLVFMAIKLLAHGAAGWSIPLLALPVVVALMWKHDHAENKTNAEESP